MTDPVCSGTALQSTPQCSVTTALYCLNAHCPSICPGPEPELKRCLTYGCFKLPACCCYSGYELCNL